MPTKSASPELGDCGQLWRMPSTQHKPRAVPRVCGTEDSGFIRRIGACSRCAQTHLLEISALGSRVAPLFGNVAATRGHDKAACLDDDAEVRRECGCSVKFGSPV